MFLEHGNSSAGDVSTLPTLPGNHHPKHPSKHTFDIIPGPMVAPFEGGFHLGEEKKSAEIRSWLYGGCGILTLPFFSSSR
ncbi:hypothetical protein TNCV_4402551 [Trichonephila clavipes]|uniref:Uncharacterized protein n=1 Tax=Trichonephila clavipes TaxID=2585209 RepID=A0A8X6VF42_TRICX|nr:hypothetical protein TNCV_4402551 [Trichonephila clavipes]